MTPRLGATLIVVAAIGATVFGFVVDPARDPRFSLDDTTRLLNEAGARRVVAAGGQP